MQLLTALLAIGGLVEARSARSVGRKEEFPRPKLVRREATVQHVRRDATPIIKTEAAKSMVLVNSRQFMLTNI